MIRRPPRSTRVRSSAASDVYKRQPQLYSDEILNARLSLYTRRHLPWVSVLMGWILFLSIGRGIELWSGLFFGVLAISSLIIPVLHIMGKTRFLAELAKITP